MNEIAHRPWPRPNGPWVMAQRWHDLLFAHWPVSLDQIRPLVPTGLEIDTYGGQAWVGVVPFRMTGVTLRRMPSLPWLSAFPELNVRTYVTAEEKPGVWFFSLDAGNALAVALARRWYHLPYFHARMTCASADGWIEYVSGRIHRGASPAEFRARYRPVGEAFSAPAGSLDDWLTARYCLYSAGPRQRLYRAEIHHAPWPLQRAEAQIDVNTMTAPDGIPLPDTAPLLHFSRRQDVVVWSPAQVIW